MERLLSDLQQHPISWAFLQPVNAEEVPDYYEVIKEPMGTYLFHLAKSLTVSLTTLI